MSKTSNIESQLDKVSLPTTWDNLISLFPEYREGESYFFIFSNRHTVHPVYSNESYENLLDYLGRQGKLDQKFEIEIFHHKEATYNEA